MINLQVLTQLLSDPELKELASRIIANKIKTDIKSVQASAELSRRLLEQGRAPGDGNLLREVAKEYLEFTSTLVDMSLAFNERLLQQLKQAKTAPAAEAGPEGLTMNVAAPLHSTVRAPFRLENNRAAPLTARFEVTPFVSEDGASLVSAPCAFDPPAVELQPGQNQKVCLIIPVTDGFDPGKTYYATLSTVGMDGMQILVKLTVEAPQETKPASTKKTRAAKKATAKAKAKARARAKKAGAGRAQRR
ncbi:MAG TPA: hypothetical protein ENJ19_07380 [Gammaproteobacteria bacterium]|nr:hypothetical protein [Gammaproteobacteria bacterium]